MLAVLWYIYHRRMESEFTTKSRSDDHLQFDLKYVLWMFISTLNHNMYYCRQNLVKFEISGLWWWPENAAMWHGADAKSWCFYPRNLVLKDNAACNIILNVECTYPPRYTDTLPHLV